MLSYTWSKVITDASDWGELPMETYDFKRERSLASYDRAHIFILSYIYLLPFWRAQSNWYEKVLGGWQLSGVTTLQSGSPLNIGIQGVVPETAARPSVLTLVGDWLGPETRFQWFNTSAFALPAAGTYGNLGRNLAIGPATNNWDVSLQKELRVSERVQTEVRIEVYNLPHHFSYFAVATTLGAANFGQVTSATDPCTLQFGMRIKF